MTFIKNSACSTLALAMLASSVFAAAPAPIATVSDASGKVLVNQGKGFVPASLNMSLKAGDRVFVGEQSLATVSYENCAVLLDKPAVITVTAEGGCDAGTSAKPVADAYAADPVVGGIPPFAILAVVGTTVIGCAVACDKILGDNDSASGN